MKCPYRKITTVKVKAKRFPIGGEPTGDSTTLTKEEYADCYKGECPLWNGIKCCKDGETDG